MSPKASQAHGHLVYCRLSGLCTGLGLEWGKQVQKLRRDHNCSVQAWSLLPHLFTSRCSTYITQV